MKYLCVCLCVFLALTSADVYNRGTWWDRLQMFDNADRMAVDMISWNLADPNIPELSQQLGLTELVKYVQQAGLGPTLSGAGTFTVFGPTNKAFDDLSRWMQHIINTREKLTKVLTYHVLTNEVRSSSLRDELLATTVNGKQLRVNLYPKGQRNFNVATVQCAPIDLRQVNEEASNGVIHVINKVMIPPYGAVAETLGACTSFNTLTTALNAARLSGTLNGPGPFTVFAPTDRAFDKLPAGTLDKLLRNTTALTEVLTYHVVSGTYCSAGLSSGNVPTLQKQNVHVRIDSSGVKVNGAKVICPDGSVTNGVVHVIDNVLIPPNLVL